MPLMPTPRQVNTLMDAINNQRQGDDDATTLTRALHAAINAAPRLDTAEPVAWAEFNEWMHSELPAGTIIGDPGWWASRIYKRFIATPNA